MTRRHAVVALVAVACAVAIVVWPRLPAEMRSAPGLDRAPIWTLSDRGIKGGLIMRLPTAPRVVVLGVSRALRFQPAYIRRRIGQTAFNAAVPHATPMDEWAHVNLLHQRFPHASFQYLWIVHVDEFDQFTVTPALLSDPMPARYFPTTFVTRRLDRFGASASRYLLADADRTHVVTLDGPAVSDAISAAAHNGSTLAERVAQMTSTQLDFYRRVPPRLDPLARECFVKTLGMMRRHPGDRAGAAAAVVLQGGLQPWLGSAAPADRQLLAHPAAALPVPPARLQPAVVDRRLAAGLLRRRAHEARHDSPGRRRGPEALPARVRAVSSAGEAVRTPGGRPAAGGG